MNGSIKLDRFTDVTQVLTSKQSPLTPQIKKEKIFEIIAEFSVDWIYWINPGGAIRFMSPSSKYITGYSAEEFLRDPGLIEKLIAPEDIKHFLHHIEDEIKGKVFCTEEFKIIAKNGEERWIAHACQSVYDDENIYIGRYVSNRDITNVKNSWCDHCVKDDIYKTASIGNYRMYPDGKFRYGNDVFLKLLGYRSLEETSNRNFEDRLFLNKEKRTKILKILDVQNTVENIETEWIKKDGSIMYVKENISAMKDENGKVRFYEGIIQNITEVKRAEISILESEIKEKKLEELKTEFLATISHEIRTPLNVILNLTEMLKTDFEKLPDTSHLENALIIENESRRIQNTIDLILDMSQLISGTYEYKPEIFLLYDDILKPNYMSRKESALKKKLDFVLVNEVNNSTIVADKYSYNKIFNQLIDNAIKYTKEGKIEIKLYFNVNGKMTVDISDTGVGINNKFLPYLFKTFSQEDNSYSRMFEGTGLGLASVKKYCEMNDAKIHVISKKGEGSTFRIILPGNYENMQRYAGYYI